MKLSSTKKSYTVPFRKALLCSSFGKSSGTLPKKTIITYIVICYKFKNHLTIIKKFTFECISTSFTGLNKLFLKSPAMYKFKMKLLYDDKEEFSCTKTKLLNFNITLQLAKLDMIGSRLVSNGSIFPGDAPVDIHLVTFYCYPTLVN